MTTAEKLDHAIKTGRPRVEIECLRQKLDDEEEWAQHLKRAEAAQLARAIAEPLRPTPSDDNNMKDAVAAIERLIEVLSGPNAETIECMASAHCVTETLMPLITNNVPAAGEAVKAGLQAAVDVLRGAIKKEAAPPVVLRLVDDPPTDPA